MAGYNVGADNVSDVIYLPSLDCVLSLKPRALITHLTRWQEKSLPTWITCVMWIALMSTPWCVTCAMSSTNPRVYWTATISSVPGACEAVPMTADSAAPSVGKR